MNNFKASFAKKPMLVLLDPEELYNLEINASDYAIGAILE